MILILTALFTVPLLINWDDYRTDFEVRLSEILGSKVELDGGLNVRLLPAPFVRAENLRIGESGKGGKPVLEVKEFTLWVAVPPLLRGVVEASTVTLDSPKLILLFDKNGRPSFDVGSKDVRGSKAQAKKTKKGKKRAVQEAAISGFQLSPNLISLRNVKVKNGSLHLQSISRLRGKKRGGSNSKIRSFDMENIDGVLSAITLQGPFYFNGKYLSEDTPHFIRLAVGELAKTSPDNKEANQAVFPVQGKVKTPKYDQEIEFDGQVGTKKGAWFAKGALKAGLGRIGRSSQKIITKTEGSSKQVIDQTQRDDATKVLVDGKAGQKKAPVAGVSDLGDQVYLTSKLHVVSNQAKMTDILVRTGSLARPQTVRGKLQIDWRDELSLSGVANGQVIDLNAALGGGALVPSLPHQSSLTVAPGVGLSKLNDLLLSQAKFFERIDFSAKVAQIYLGNGDVRDFSLNVKGRDGRIQVEDLSGRMAGNTRLTVRGDFIEKDKGASFNGSLYLRGLQFQEFLRWAVPSYQGDHKFGRGKYMLSGGVVSEGGGFYLNGLQGALGRSSLRGDFTFVKGSKNLNKESETLKDPNSSRSRAEEMRLSLRFGPLRIEDLLGESIDLKNFESEFSKVFETRSKQTTKKTQASSLHTVIDLSAQKVIFNDSVQKDVRLVWRDIKGRSFIESLSGVSERGLKLTYENGQADVSLPKVSLSNVATGEVQQDKFFIEVLNEAALKELMGISGLDQKYKISKLVGDGFYPLNFGVRREISDDFTHYRFDGQMGGSDTAFSVSIPLEGADKKPGVMTILGGMESSDGAFMAAKFIPFALRKRVDGNNLGASKVTFTASGTGKDGFRGQVKLSNKIMNVSYLGQFSLNETEVTSDGEVLISSDKARDVLSLFGLGHLSPAISPTEEGQSLKAKAQFSKVQNGFALSDLKVALGDTQIVGTGLFEEKEGQPHYRLALATERLDFKNLLGVLQKQSAHVNGGAEVQVARLETNNNKTDGATNVLGSVWSTQSFDLGAGEKEQAQDGKSNLGVGDFSIRVSELVFSEKLSLSDAIIRWRAYSNYIEIVKIEGKSLGGVFKASGTLRERGETYNLNGTVIVEKGQLEEIGAAEEASLGAGEFSLNLSLSGSGKSPEALVKSLIGEGFVKLSDGALRQVNPLDLSQLAERFLQSENGDAKQLKTDLVSAVQEVKPLKFASLDLGLQLLDGAVKVRQKDFGIRPGVIGLQAELNLVDLSWFGRWSIQPQPRKSIGKVPSVIRNVQGNFQSVAGFQSILDVNEFERFLTLKHKERELRTLEKIRLEEEARRLAEERRRAEEELKRINEEKARLKKEQEKFDNLNRTELPPLPQ